MRASFAVVAVSAAAGLLVALAPALAQQKTVAACQGEWRANRAANQAAGITEKDYVEKCRAGSTAAAPTAAPSKPGGTAAAPTAAPSKPTAQTAAPAARTPTTKNPATVGVAAPTGANQFSSAALAKAHCASDTVVWANLGSRIYHFSGSKDFGNTKEGAYMCERDAVGQGIRAAKNEKHP